MADADALMKKADKKCVRAARGWEPFGLQGPKVGRAARVRR